MSTDRPPNTSPMAYGMMQLAEAHATLALGCTKTFTAPKLSKGGRPLPWVLGLGPSPVMAEPWGHLHKLHRRKRGFRALCDRLTVLLKSVRSMPHTDGLILQVWEDEGTIDRPLLEKVSRQIDQPILVFGPDEIHKAIRLVQAQITDDLQTHNNPILAVLSWITSRNS